VKDRAIAFERKPHGPIRFSIAALDAFNARYTVDARPQARRVRRAAKTSARPGRADVDRRFGLARMEAGAR
jgi:hypothetical protein